MLLGRRMRRECYRPSGRGRGPFDRYKKEEEKATREAVVEENPRLRQLMDIFLNAVKKSPNEFAFYKNANDFLFSNGIRPSRRDVEILSLALGEFEEEASSYGGMFLSCLVNRGRDFEYVIHTSHLPPLDKLGFKFDYRIMMVHGGAGDYLGYEMQNSKYYMAGSRYPGSVIMVNGDVGDYLGFNMKGGRITVKGNAGRFVGTGMTGGDIYLQRGYASVGQPRGGRVRHNGLVIMS